MLIPESGILSPQDLNEIQGLVIFGTNFPRLRYHFFEITEPAKARSFLGSFVAGDRLRVTSATKSEADYRLYVALTSLGLQALGEPMESLKTFPEEFRQGARARASELGDVGDSAPEHWLIEHDRIHIAVMLYAKKEAFEAYSQAIIDAAAASGCVYVRQRTEEPIDGEALDDIDLPTGQQVARPVHFNFRDGVSQPALLGVRERADDPGPPAVPPGMFVLGHPFHPDQPTQPSFSLANQPVPEPRDLGFNGAFGAFRMLEQDCDAFEEFLDVNSHSGAERELLAARMCGRWRNGRPLTTHPNHPTPVPEGDRSLNDFDYCPTSARPNAIDDNTGALCPIGSHIRRANPRSADVLGQTGNRIRLVRRGMPYGPTHQRGDGKKRGMLGLFLCASLKHQFEFVQKHWINDGLFAKGLPPGEHDPLVGANADGAPFTFLHGGQRTGVRGLTQFVKTRGAAYLFFPSVPALGFLAKSKVRDRERPALIGAQLEISEQDRVDTVVANMLARLGRSPKRDAHPKHHGVVRAVFEVLPDLPPELAHGLFARGDKFNAYVRFSNGSPRMSAAGELQADSIPDSRGMAIKLLGVPGDKLMDDEQRTHDFVLASHPVFFTRDLGEYLRFLDTAPQNLPRAFPLLFASFHNHDNPLSTTYFSQTPYRLGVDQVVKYVAVPVEPEPAQPFVMSDTDPRRHQPHYLRDAMAAHLLAHESILDFHVQFRPDGANVDDAIEPWNTPFHRIARITVPLQQFATVRQDTFAENMSFSPWHCLEAHRPLGSINLARRSVYVQASTVRHRNSGTQRREPDGSNDF